MKKLIIGLVLAVLGVVSCVGGSALAVMPVATQAVSAPLIPAGGELVVDEAKAFTLMLATTGTVDGQDIATRTLPPGDYGFLAADGTAIELDRSQNIGMDSDDVIVVGMAQLEPGTYTIRAPERDPPLYFKVLGVDVESMAVLLTASCGLGVLLGLAGLIVAVLGIAQMSRERREAREARA